MKNSLKKRSRSPAKSISPPIPIPRASVSVVVGGMISTLQGLRGVFGRPIDAEIGQLIKLTKALRDQAGGAASAPTKRK